MRLRDLFFLIKRVTGIYWQEAAWFFFAYRAATIAVLLWLRAVNFGPSVVHTVVLFLRLCSEAGPEAEHISGKKAEIKNKWRNLQGAIHSYRDRLSIAANIQAFQVHNSVEIYRHNLLGCHLHHLIWSVLKLRKKLVRWVMFVIYASALIVKDFKVLMV
jgi:hypothetical protein